MKALVIIPFLKTILKALAIIILTIIVISFLVSCGNGPEPGPALTTAEEPCKNDPCSCRINSPSQEKLLKAILTELQNHNACLSEDCSQEDMLKAILTELQNHNTCPSADSSQEELLKAILTELQTSKEDTCSPEDFSSQEELLKAILLELQTLNKAPEYNEENFQKNLEEAAQNIKSIHLKFSWDRIQKASEEFYAEKYPEKDQHRHGLRMATFLRFLDSKPHLRDSCYSQDREVIKKECLPEFDTFIRVFAQI